MPKPRTDYLLWQIAALQVIAKFAGCSTAKALEHIDGEMTLMGRSK